MTVSEAGRLGGLHRWRNHVPTRLHIGDLDSKRREIVLAFIEAERKAQERERQS